MQPRHSTVTGLFFLCTAQLLAGVLYRIRTILVTVTNNVFGLNDGKCLIINALLFWYGFNK
jgi:hypothetical protein